MKGTAIVFSNGIFDSRSAKTTHGLIRGSERFEIMGVIDSAFHGKDAGELLDGKHRSIPIYKDVSEFLHSGKKADYAVIGVAPAGGQLPAAMRQDVLKALSNGMDLVSGLHEFLMDDVELADVAKKGMAKIHDIRKPRPKKDLAFWGGDIQEVSCPKLVVMGDDCGLGKRTTAKFTVDALRDHGFKSEMIFTGQTGWMQGWKYGFILDSTVNDFVSGELEHMMVKCFREEKPDAIVVEGQAALRNPSGPCGAEFLISGRMDGVILQHAPERKYYEGVPHLKIEIPSVKSEIELIAMYGVPVIAVTLNTKGLTHAEAKKYQTQYEADLGIPVLLPIEEGLDRLVPIIEKMMKK
jgi:uncharacterized NAD-dependent epimerase/dehydratase family protein